MLLALLIAAQSAVLDASPAVGVPVGEAVVRDGLRIAADYNGALIDRLPMPANGIHLEARITAAKDEPHGFAENQFVPYLTVNYTLTRDDNLTFRRAGLLYPTAATTGPHYGGNVEMTGPGVYHLSYIISPPSSHGMLRHTGKDSGVPDWFKPITATWTFAYPEKTP